ncbi:EF-hand domain-containing protein [Aegicerativicinus sediminis]|uniref:EF-hand domain-containing protein n=1 Tax=Aegicerativicinus sediminis TaxID=2893202 RepID=UPI001E5DE753|nr:EF-hand domain-containing protein [Aegicerativicinus sediminis]
MDTNDSILEKIQILITKYFSSPQEAFRFFDKNSDGKLSSQELVKLLKEAEISGFIRGIVARKLIESYDTSGDHYVDWEEFKMAYSELLGLNQEKKQN